MSTTTDTAAVVEMRNISVAFGGVQAVDNVSIELRAGEVLGLLGHNGAGKSTLISILAGANAMDSGEIIVNDKVVQITSPKTAKTNGIETIYQNLALANNLDAVSNLFLGRELRRFGLFRRTKKMTEEAGGVFEQINPRFKNHTSPAGSLSGGQRQTIAIARAIYFKAKILIMDEPTAALGPSETAMFKDVVLRLKRAGVAIVMISHDMQEVFDLADRLVVMADGKVVGRLNTHDATKDEVLSMIILTASAFGSRYVVFQNGEPAPGVTEHQARQTLREIYDRIAPVAEEQNVIVGFEAARSFSLFNSPHGALELVRDFGSPYITVAPDFEAWRIPSERMPVSYVENPGATQPEPLDLSVFIDCLPYAPFVHAKLLEFDADGNDPNYPVDELMAAVRDDSAPHDILIEYEGWLPDVYPDRDPEQETLKGVELIRRLSYPTMAGRST